MYARGATEVRVDKILRGPERAYFRFAPETDEVGGIFDETPSSYNGYPKLFIAKGVAVIDRRV